MLNFLFAGLASSLKESTGKFSHYQKHVYSECESHRYLSTCNSDTENKCYWHQHKCISCSNPMYAEVCPSKQTQMDIVIKDLGDKESKVENGRFGSRNENICYATYSDDGCPTCHSRDPSVTCGWCQSEGFCTEGNAKGPHIARCPRQYWIFNQTQCTNDMCSIATSKYLCRSPCKWSSLREKCSAPIHIMDVANGIVSSVQNVVEMSKGFMIAAGVIMGLVVVVAIVGFFINSRSHVYNNLPMMKEHVTLNDIPSL